MKRNQHFLLLLTVAILGIAFSSFSKGGKKPKKFAGYTPTDGGSYFLLHKKGTSLDAVDTGGAVFLKIKFKTVQDSVFMDLNQAARSPSYPMRIDKPRYKGDFIDLMTRLHQGDSASFFVSLDSLKKHFPNEFNFEPKYDTMKYLGFTVQIDSIYHKAKVDEIRAKAKAEQQAQQAKMMKLKSIMQPITDTARAREPMLREKDFELLSGYIKNSWKGPRNPDNDGIFYQELLHGNGTMIQPGMIVSLKYTGKYLDGTIFDSNTIFEGQDLLTFRFGVDQMIEGFSICVSKMSVGTKSIFILPPRLGYKDGLTRIFEVEVVSVKTQ